MNMQIDTPLMGWVAFATVSIILLGVIVWQLVNNSSYACAPYSVPVPYVPNVYERNPLITKKTGKHPGESVSGHYNNVCSDYEVSDDDLMPPRRQRYIYSRVADNVENRKPRDYYPYRRDHPSMMYRTEYSPYRTVLEHMDMNTKFNNRMFQPTPLQHTRPLSYREMKKSAANSPSTTACSPLASSIV